MYSNGFRIKGRDKSVIGDNPKDSNHDEVHASKFLGARLTNHDEVVTANFQETSLTGASLTEHVYDDEIVRTVAESIDVNNILDVDRLQELSKQAHEPPEKVLAAALNLFELALLAKSHDKKMAVIELEQPAITEIVGL